MRRVNGSLVALSVLALAGCSKSDHGAPENKFGYTEGERSQRVTTVDIAEERNAAAPAMAPPGIDVTAAPGVAFDYRYAFVLPDSAISSVQEEHASACEKLGPARCRITGMRFTLVDEDEVRAQLQFKLDPTLARNFGKEGIAAVAKAKGRLVDAAIEGRDVGTALSQSQRRSQQNAGEVERIERRLAGSGLSEAEKVELRGQIERLRQQQTREQQVRDEGEEMLANTPMTFNYAGRKGFSLGDDPIGDAWSTSQSSFTAMVSMILIAIGALLPWALLVGAVALLWRKTPLRRLWPFRKPVRDGEPAVLPASPPDPAPLS
jgi:hypothetical protein